MRLQVNIRYVEHAEPRWEWEIVDLNDPIGLVEFGEADTFDKAEADAEAAKNAIVEAYENT